MVKELKNKKGITLIALIVTIIIMLILAGVTIKLVKDEGLFNYARKAKSETENAISYEQELINKMYNLVDDNAQGSSLAVHNWTRTGDTFTCSHCSATYEMGQLVDYTPKGEKTKTTITAAKSGLDKYYTANSNYPANANADANGAQIIEVQNTNWVVLGIEDTNKDGKYETLLITTKEPVGTTSILSQSTASRQARAMIINPGGLAPATIPEKKLYFYGAAGYNNGPSELKRVCKELYSNSEYGIARSMTIEDVNSCLNDPLKAMSLGGIYPDSAGNFKTTGNLTTKIKDLPIFSELIQNGTKTPDGINTEEALGNYKLNGYNYRLNTEKTGLENAVNEATSTITEAEKNVIFGENANYGYFLASRIVRGILTQGIGGVIDPETGEMENPIDYRNWQCCFEISAVNGLGVGHYNTFASDGSENVNSAGLRPVVLLKSKLPPLGSSAGDLLQ